MARGLNDFITPSRDSLIVQTKKSLAISKEDTNKVKLLLRLTGFYMWSYPDIALSYSIHGLELSKKLHFKEGELRIFHYKGEAFAIKEIIPGHWKHNWKHSIFRRILEILSLLLNQICG